MKIAAALALLPILGAQAIRIVQGNDDGWAEQYARVFNKALKDAGHKVVLSAPAENKSGSGSLDARPSDRKSACQYKSCPPNSGPVGHNTTDLSLNWVNAFPVTGVKYGIDTFGPQLWDDQGPELVVTGPNVGSNVWLAIPFSGTVGAAAFAVKNFNIPAIAFSGDSGGTLAWDEPIQDRSRVYAELATFFTNKIIASGKPYLPEGAFLNVNFPKIEGECTDASKFKWVLTRMTSGLLSPPDVVTCGTDRLSRDLDIIHTDGCYISVSVGDAADKTTMNDVQKQRIVLDKLSDILSCEP